MKNRTNKNEIREMIMLGGCATHAGVFHADDVFSTALLKIVFPELSINPKRVFVLPPDFKGLAYDIGFGEFDHHQRENVPEYEDGTKKAAFGLLWDALGEETYGYDVYQDIKDNFIKPLDENDNYGSVVSFGKAKHPLADAIGCFNPNFDEDANKVADAYFKKAVHVAKMILEEKINSSISLYKGKSIVEEAPIVSKFKILPKFACWKQFLPEGCIGVVFPSLRGGYAIQVRDSDITPLPEEWLDEKPEGCAFVHNSLFLASFETEEQAIKAVREMEEMENNF